MHGRMHTHSKFVSMRPCIYIYVYIYIYIWDICIYGPYPFWLKFLEAPGNAKPSNIEHRHLCYQLHGELAVIFRKDDMPFTLVASWRVGASSTDYTAGWAHCLPCGNRIQTAFNHIHANRHHQFKDRYYDDQHAPKQGQQRYQGCTERHREA